MTSLLQKINDLNVRVDNVSTSGGSTDTTALQAQIDTNTTDISGIQTNKQNTLIAGDNITITGNTISASGGGGGGGIIGFRACGDGTFSITIAFGQTISTKMIVYNNQLNSSFDSNGTYNSTNGIYTIPTGYSGWWEVHLKIYMLTYVEGNAMISLRQNTTTIINSGDFQGQRGDFSTYVKVNEGDEMRIRQEQNTGKYSFFVNRSWWSMRFIASSI